MAHEYIQVTVLLYRQASIFTLAVDTQCVEVLSEEAVFLSNSIRAPIQTALEYFEEVLIDESGNSEMM